MGNWKLTRAQEPQALTEPVLREMRHGQVGGTDAPPAHPPLASAPPWASGCWRSRPARWASCGPTWPAAASAARSTWAPSRPSTRARRSRASRWRTARRPTSRRRAPSCSSSTPTWASRTASQPTGRAPPPTCARCGRSARTWAASPTSATSTTGSSAPATARATTGWAPRSRSSAPPRAALTASPTWSENGELIVDTSTVILGPLPVALGQPGLIPAKSPGGCI